jgi:hypothetical protein
MGAEAVGDAGLALLTGPVGDWAQAANARARAALAPRGSILIMVSFRMGPTGLARTISA